MSHQVFSKENAQKQNLDSFTTLDKSKFFFFLFFPKTYVVGTHQLLESTHNMFSEKKEMFFLA